MRLEVFVKPEHLKPGRPILVRDVLAHLLLLSNETNAGRKVKTVVAGLYRRVAIDYLAALGVTQKSEVYRLASNIVM